MLRPYHFLLFLMGPALASAGSSASYALSPDTLDAGGLTAVSPLYRATFSHALGDAGNSASYQLRGGFCGQLGEAVELRVRATPAALAEGGTTQLEADLISETGGVTPLPPAGVSWTILRGPLNGISQTGLVTASPVYQDTSALVRAESGLYSADFTLLVRDTNADNFSVYAGDGLPDLWQVSWFGEASSRAGLHDDPDGDFVDNFLEFAFDTDPLQSASGSNRLGYLGNPEGGGTFVVSGSPYLQVLAGPSGEEVRGIFVRRKNYIASGLDYNVLFSADLVNWQRATGSGLVLTSNRSAEVVAMVAPLLSAGGSARFLKVTVTKP